MEKTIDLNAIFEKHTLGKPFRCGLIIDAMKEACEQTVDLCTENAKVIGGGFYGQSGKIDKDKIINTKNQIK